MTTNLSSKVACLLGFLGIVVSAPATTLTLADVVGTWGIGYNNPTDTEMAANKLVAWYNGGLNPNPDVNATFALNIPGPTAPLPFPLATAARAENASVSPVFTGVQYVVGKYANTNVLFYGAPYSSFQIPNLWDVGLSPNGNELSHWQSFGARVPDNGWTLALVASALLAMALGGRRGT